MEPTPGSGGRAVDVVTHLETLESPAEESDFTATVDVSRKHFWQSFHRSRCGFNGFNGSSGFNVLQQRGTYDICSWLETHKDSLFCLNGGKLW